MVYKNYDSFFHDLSFFFHLPSARWEDYKILEEITHITAHYVKKDGSTRWLSMKQVGVSVTEQIENLSKYFLSFLPKQKGSKRSERYERIVEQLKRPDILPSCYLYHKIFKGFCDFSTMISQWFTCSGLRLFSLLEVWCQNSLQGNNCLLRMIQNQMTKFLKLILLIKNVCKKASLIDVGTKAKVPFSGDVIGDEREQKFRKECLKFYQINVKYLLEYLPHDCGLKPLMRWLVENTRLILWFNFFENAIFFNSSSKNLMLVNELVLIIYPPDLFSIEFSSGISTIGAINEGLWLFVTTLQ